MEEQRIKLVESVQSYLAKTVQKHLTVTAFMKNIVEDMEINERVAYYYMNKSQHIVELAFVEAKNKKG
jgi:hypothetical protein